jgi:hypothetical protein
MLLELLAGYNWRDDLILGGFSEAKANYELFGREFHRPRRKTMRASAHLSFLAGIAFGGAGMVISRSLLRKMLPLRTFDNSLRAFRPSR